MSVLSGWGGVTMTAPSTPAPLTCGDCVHCPPIACNGKEPAQCRSTPGALYTFADCPVAEAPPWDELNRPCPHFQSRKGLVAEFTGCSVVLRTPCNTCEAKAGEPLHHSKSYDICPDCLRYNAIYPPQAADADLEAERLGITVAELLAFAKGAGLAMVGQALLGQRPLPEPVCGDCEHHGQETPRGANAFGDTPSARYCEALKVYREFDQPVAFAEFGKEGPCQHFKARPKIEQHRCGRCRSFFRDLARVGDCAEHGHRVQSAAFPQRPGHDGDQYTGELVPCEDFRPIRCVTDVPPDFEGSLTTRERVHVRVTRIASPEAAVHLCQEHATVPMAGAQLTPDEAQSLARMLIIAAQAVVPEPPDIKVPEPTVNEWSAMREWLNPRSREMAVKMFRVALEDMNAASEAAATVLVLTTGAIAEQEGLTLEALLDGILAHAKEQRAKVLAPKKNVGQA